MLYFHFNERARARHFFYSSLLGGKIRNGCIYVVTEVVCSSFEEFIVGR